VGATGPLPVGDRPFGKANSESPCDDRRWTTVGPSNERSGRWPRFLVVERGCSVAAAFIALIAVVSCLSGSSALVASASSGKCGPDEASALASALAQAPPGLVADQVWDPIPLESNYDPCADLSTILVTIDGATGSSPIQALMFHRGAYLGTGTWKAYGFTSLDEQASTRDTVVLRYRWGQSCTACADGFVTTVRYHWDGTRVDMLDPPPPE
jgi:hypothetical protein